MPISPRPPISRKTEDKEVKRSLSVRSRTSRNIPDHEEEAKKDNDTKKPQAAISDAVSKTHYRIELGEWLPPNSITVILSWWSQARKRGDTSNRVGSAENAWYLKVYRHPHQQFGRGHNNDYQIGHDLYALGVCLLEIGL